MTFFWPFLPLFFGLTKGKTAHFFCIFFMRIVSILSSKGRKPRSATLRAGFAGAFRARRYRVQNASPRRKNRTMRRGSAHRNTRAASLCFRKSGDSCKVLKPVSRASQNLTFAKCCFFFQVRSPRAARPAPRVSGRSALLAP